MDTIIQHSLRDRIIQFFGKRVVYHSLFWLTMLFLLIFLDSGPTSFNSFSIEVINVLFYAILIYFNLYYLIPNYLTGKKFLYYVFFLTVSVILVTPIKILIFYFIFNTANAQQQLLNELNLYFIANFVVMGASTIVKIISDWARHQRERKELETQTMQSELRFLKSQINPHFLFNTLNNLYALTLKKSDKAPEIVIKLSEMMRYMLYECNEKKVPLSKEVNYLKNYLDLEKLRQAQKVIINFDVEGEVEDQKIAPLLFIPFLENSFKHGLNNHISQGFVNIKIKVVDKHIHLFIENSKPDALPMQVHKRSGGIGLVNVRRRLDLIYPNNYELNINDNPKTYQVELDLELG